MPLCYTDQVGRDRLTSRKYANGAAESFTILMLLAGKALNATQFGVAILMNLDSAGCINNAFPASNRQFITTAGTSGSRPVGFF